MPGTKNGFRLLIKLKVAWGIQINSVINAMTGNTKGVTGNSRCKI